MNILIEKNVMVPMRDGVSLATDGHASYPRAIGETMGSDILHRKNTYLTNRLEQDHRGIKQR
jgi:putative transposase